MANAVLATYQTLSNYTLTAASLATSSSYAGRQSTMVDNSTNRWPLIYNSLNTKLGTSPTASKFLYFSTIRSDKNSTAIRDLNAGASDAAMTNTNKNLDTLVTISCGSAATGDVFKKIAIMTDPGPEFGIHLSHDTGVNLDSTGGNHVFSWRGVNPEIQ